MFGKIVDNEWCTICSWGAPSEVERGVPGAPKQLRNQTESWCESVSKQRPIARRASIAFDPFYDHAKLVLA